MPAHSKPILYAEDDENDTFFVTRAMQQAAMANPLVSVPDGGRAMDYLSGKGPYLDRVQHPLPCLALLDLNMPGKSGLDVLKWIRANADLKTLPVLILTSSALEADVQQAYLHGANGYLVKPGGPVDLLTMVRAIKDFWFEQNRMPRIPV
jgi:CheY-like chemotaxis protein